MRRIVSEAYDVHRRSGVRRTPRIDRTKHEVDIAERVLAGGVWTGSTLPQDSRLVDIDFDKREWSLGTVDTAVQVRTLDPDRSRD
jgi:hypothetical protein